jgi:hypothetical protein
MNEAADFGFRQGGRNVMGASVVHENRTIGEVDRKRLTPLDHDDRRVVHILVLTG